MTDISNTIPVSVTLHGVRGTLPVSGPEFARHGSRTICIEVQAGEDRLIFDAGTGIFPASQAIWAEGVGAIELFLTHCHYDHVIGLPFIPHLFHAGASVRIWSGHAMPERRTADIVCALLAEPFCPITMDLFRAEVAFRDFLPGDVLEPRAGVTLRTGPLRHPGGAVGYRIEVAGRVIAVITDTEHDPAALDPHVLTLIEGADLMLYDATLTDAEMATHAGWGHSSWQEALRLAERAGVARVGLIHHSPKRGDAELDAIAAEAAARFPGAFVGRDDQRIVL